MKRIQKKYEIVLMSLGIFTAALITIYACSGGYEISGFFSPHVSKANKYLSFYRTNYMQFYDFYKEDNIHDFDSVNIASWYDFFKQKIYWTDLKNTVYQYSKEEIDTMIFRLRDNNYPASEKITNNSVLYYQDKKIISDFLFYLGYAKRCEPYSTTIFLEPEERAKAWAIEATRIEPNTKKNYLEYLFEGGNKQIKNTKSDFIRERYMFQVGRLYFQIGRYKDCCEYYESVIDKFKTRQNIKYRFMSYAAGAYFKLQNYAKSNYLFSVVFDNCAELRKECAIGFHPQEESDFAASLNLAKNNHEKTSIWFLLGYYRDPQRAMREIYKLEPKNELLDVLLVRYIDLAEEYMEIDPFMAPVEDSSKVKSIKEDWLKLRSAAIADSDVVFLKSVADKGNSNKPYLWDLTAGYLSIVQGNFADAHKYLVRAGKKIGNDKLLQAQLRVFNFYLTIEEAPIITNKLYSFIMDELAWFDKNKELMLSEIYTLQDWASGRIAAKHYGAGEFTYAECWNRGFDKSFYNDEAKMSSMVSFLHKENKGKYENYVQQHCSYQPCDLFDLQGVMALQGGDIPKALNKFATSLEESELFKKKTGKPGIEESYYCTIFSDADPFMTSIRERDTSEWHAMNGRQKYSKLSFTKKLVELLKKIEAKPSNIDELYFQLGTAFYNMTYFGNSRQLYQTRIREYGVVSFYDPESKNLSIVDCKVAKQYFQKALGSARNSEMKAKCCFMLARCEQNEFFLHVPEGYQGDFKAGQYFRTLKSDYADTKYYQEILKECGYFRTFIGQ